MKTKGLKIHFGYVFAESLAAASGYGQVPVQFWNRVKHAIVNARLVDEFKAEEAQAKSDVDPARSERRLFESWVARLGLEVPPGHYTDQRLWPWTRGWTPEAVDSYLTTEAKRDAA